MDTPTDITPLRSAVLERSAVLDEAQLGDIEGALGTIARHDVAPRVRPDVDSLGNRARCNDSRDSADALLMPAPIAP